MEENPHKIFLQQSFATKSSFEKTYKLLYSERNKIKAVFCELVEALNHAVEANENDTFKNYYKLLHYLSDLENYELLRECVVEDVNFPDNNFVITACKRNNEEVLMHMKDTQPKVLRVFLDFPDKSDCNPLFYAVYYAMRSNNVTLFDSLLQCCRKIATPTTPFDDIVAAAYEKLKTINVPIAHSMDTTIQQQLLGVQFYFNPKCDIKPSNNILFQNAINRIGLILDNVEYLLTHQNVDECFIYVMKVVVNNIFILKSYLRASYVRIPWEEFELYLIKFIKYYTTQDEINILLFIYLEKESLLEYLDIFAQMLRKETDILKNTSNKKKKDVRMMPRLSRKNVIHQITEEHPKLKVFYDEYSEIRDISSLTIIVKYIKLANKVNVTKDVGRLVVERALQVLGELMKNTLESPKMSDAMINLLHRILPHHMRMIIIEIRDAFFHTSQNTQKLDSVTRNNLFERLQQEIRKLGEIIDDVLSRKEIAIIRKIFEKMYSYQDVNDYAKMNENLRRVGIHKMRILKSKSKLTHDQNQKLLFRKLDTIIENKTPLENEIIDSIHKLAKKMLPNNIDTDLNSARGNLHQFHYMQMKYYGAIDDQVLQVFKDGAETALRNLKNNISNDNHREIPLLIEKLIESIEIRLPSETAVQIKDEIHNAIIMFDPNVSALDEFKSLLKNEDCSPFKCTETETIPETSDTSLGFLEADKDILGNKIKELDKLFGAHKQFTIDDPVSVALEVHILDILTILDRNHCLTNNYLYMNHESPILTGRALRNHLAHQNSFTEIFHADASVVLYANAKQMVHPDFLNNLRFFKIGVQPEDDIGMITQVITKRKNAIQCQAALYSALQNGNMVDVQEAINNGADIEGVSLLEGNSTLHFAARNANVEILEYLNDHKLQLNWNAKNRYLQNLLHVAIESPHDNETILHRLLQEKVDVDAKDLNCKTPLHLAAERGQMNALEILLANDADTKSGANQLMSPLQLAALNKHIAAVRLLLKYELDLNVCFGKMSVLHEAAESGDVAIVEELLNNDAEIDIRGDGESTPLCLAAKFGRLEVVKLLIQRGANANITFNGLTALHMAVEGAHLEVVKYLIESGSPVDARDHSYQNTPLHHAGRQNAIAIAEYLLQHGAKPLALTYEGMTALHWAVEDGFVDMLKLLLSYKYDVNIADNKVGEVPLHLAARNGRLDMVELIWETGKAVINARNSSGLTALHLACWLGHFDVVKFLIEQGATCDASVLHTTVYFKTRDLLEKHAQLGKLEYFFRKNKIYVEPLPCNMLRIMQLLLEQGLDVNAPDSKGMTTLHFACSYNHEEAASWLIQHGADINAQNKIKQTPLHCAVCLSGNIHLIEMLIEHGALPNRQDEDGITPLHLAIQTFPDAAHLFIAKGCDLTVRTEPSPLLIAVSCNETKIVQRLIAGGIDLETDGLKCIGHAIKLGNRQMVENLLKFDAHLKYGTDMLWLCASTGNATIGNLLVNKGVSIHRTFNSLTLLHVAAIAGHANFVQMLIDNGADINEVTSNGYTALMQAIEKNHVKVVQSLIENNANINIRDKEGRSALEFAASNGNLEIVKLIIENGKSVNINENGMFDFTVLHIAVQENNYKVVKYLLEKGANMHARNILNTMPVHIAARNGHKSIVELLFKHGQHLDDDGIANKSILHYAAMSCKYDIAEYLIKIGIDVNVKDVEGLTPLCLYCVVGQEKVVRLLLNHGALIDFKSKIIKLLLNLPSNYDVDYVFGHISGNMHQMRNKVTHRKYPNISNMLKLIMKLFAAIKANDMNGLEDCMKQNCVVNAKHTNNYTALIFASWKGNVRMVKILLKNGANPNIGGNHNCTALHYAAKFSHYDCVLQLLQHGAVYNPVASQKTPLDMTTDKRIVDLLNVIAICFDSVQNKNNIVVSKLQNLANASTILQACNHMKRTLIVEAMISDYPFMDDLNFIKQNPNDFIVAQTLGNHNRFDEAIAMYNQILNTRRELYGDDSPSTLIIDISIAQMQEKNGNNIKALKKYRHIELKQTEFLGKDHYDVLMTQSIIARVQQRLGYNEEALRMFNNILKKPLPDDENLSIIKMNMGLALLELQRFEEALKIFRESHEEWSKSKGPGDPMTIRALHNIATVYINMGDEHLDEALQINRKVYDEKVKLFGENDRETMRTLRNIAAVYGKQHNFKKCDAMLSDLLSKQKCMFGETDLETLTTKHSLAASLISQNKSIAAYYLMKQIPQAPKGASNHMAKMARSFIEVFKMSCRWQGETIEQLENYLRAQIQTAVFTGDSKTLVDLIKKGVDLNETDQQGNAPVHYVIHYGHTRLLRIVLKSGIDTSVLTKKGNTILHLACNRKRLDMVMLILEYLSDDQIRKLIDAKTFDGQLTALHIAAKKNRFDIMLLLLGHGACYNPRNKADKTPQDLYTSLHGQKFLKNVNELYRFAKLGDMISICDWISEECQSANEFEAFCNMRDANGMRVSELLSEMMQTQNTLPSNLLALLRGIHFEPREK